MRPRGRWPVREGERGAALLTVLILVAVIAVLAATALEKLRLSTRLGGNALAVEQARAFAQAGEALALVRIGGLLQRSPDRVSLLGDWSDRPFGLPLPGGDSAVARVTDGGNCFNLNSLVRSLPDAPGVYASDPQRQAEFMRLMGYVGVPAQVAAQVAAGASDWIDTDQDQQSGGGEDPLYLARETPYRTPGTLMADVSELRAVNGVTAEVYETLRPWLCTLPTNEPSAINVNTLLPEQAPLVAMLFQTGVNPETIRQQLLRRPPQGFAEASAAWQGVGGEPTSQPGVKTQWFALRIDVTLGTTQIEERGLVDARTLPVRLTHRQWGEDL